MPSVLGWIVLDEKHKRDVMETIALFREPGTVDELGIGTVRDALSDLMFPGTSVLQTRAKYLLFVPWIYDSVHRDGLSGDAAVRTAQNRETQLISALLAHERTLGVEVPGIIGRVARGSLKRKPSSVYWAALQRCGILRWNVSISGYCRSLRPSPGGRVRLARDEDGNAAHDDGPWAHLPEPEDHSSQASFDLSIDQAQYLRDRVAITQPRSMLAWLVARDPIEIETVEAPWAHPALAEVPPAMADVIGQAQWFSSVVHGAALLYNLMLAEAGERGDRDSLIEEYRHDLDEWQDQINLLGALDADGFWAVLHLNGARIPGPTRRFLEHWFRLVALGRAGADSGDACELIRRREYQLKGGRARLHNPRQLERWSGSSGTDPLVYRWPVVRTLVHDIARPLSLGGEHALP